MTTNTICDTPKRCLCRNDDIDDDGECCCFAFPGEDHCSKCFARLIVIDVDTGEAVVS